MGLGEHREDRPRRLGLTGGERGFQKDAHVLRRALHGPILLGKPQCPPGVVLRVEDKLGVFTIVEATATPVHGGKARLHLRGIKTCARIVQGAFREDDA